MSAAQCGLRRLIFRYVDRLRFPYLLALTATLLVLDLLVPDAIPFADEILLGLATLVLARMKRPELPAPPKSEGT